MAPQKVIISILECMVDIFVHITEPIETTVRAQAAMGWKRGKGQEDGWRWEAGVDGWRWPSDSSLEKQIREEERESRE